MYDVLKKSSDITIGGMSNNTYLPDDSVLIACDEFRSLESDTLKYFLENSPFFKNIEHVKESHRDGKKLLEFYAGFDRAVAEYKTTPTTHNLANIWDTLLDGYEREPVVFQKIETVMDEKKMTFDKLYNTIHEKLEQTPEGITKKMSQKNNAELLRQNIDALEVSDELFELGNTLEKCKSVASLSYEKAIGVSVNKIDDRYILQFSYEEIRFWGENTGMVNYRDTPFLSSDAIIKAHTHSNGYKHGIHRTNNRGIGPSPPDLENAKSNGTAGLVITKNGDDPLAYLYFPDGTIVKFVRNEAHKILNANEFN